jgi:hypothetical protein
LNTIYRNSRVEKSYFFRPVVELLVGDDPLSTIVVLPEQIHVVVGVL